MDNPNNIGGVNYNLNPHISDYFRLILLLNELQSEILRAQGMYTPIHSLHEGYALMAEELNKEVFEHVCLKQTIRDHPKIHKELIQVAAMALRTAFDVIDRDIRN